MHGSKNPNQNKGQEQGKKNKTFAELAEKGLEHFGELKNELLNFQKSSKIDEVFNKTEEFVKNYSQSITAHQLRNIYQEIKKANEVLDLKLLRPNLAYIAGRLDKGEGKEFVAFVDALIREVDSKEKLENFKDFMEAVVAYHKFYSSK
ncbi:type III-A CRISPR-associated protein Csm2 [Raineya orbicola]|uniref:CRISPR system Cms protein Csm2 n=1 Tax=Raineya orbicola TaxID=2016530 RepID=A0A2N3IBP1_9BACT|nr:type III-A CRISPR-associated protein Csm2 [Raineya orbicola]PKQ67673.1 CRISPR type III-A/MTUBE-associated protein Csm2 [Raineya orbicola]